MVEITLYAIRQISTGMYLTEPRNKFMASKTHAEPDICDGMSSAYPRLFPKRINAKNALVQWLRGKHELQMSWNPGSEDDGDSELVIEPQPHRKKEDMEVVEVILTIP